MQKVSSLVSSKIGDTLTNIKTWGPLVYNVLENGLIGDGSTDDTASLQALINTAIAAGRRTIAFPHTSTGGEYYVTALTNADQVDFVGDNCVFVGGYAGTITDLGGIAALEADVTQRAINVKQPPYNAAGNGTSDDSIAIQNAANSLSTSGGVLLFPTGTYKIGTTITLPSNVIIKGVGDGAVIKLANGDMTGFLISNKHNVTIRDLKISCDVAGTTSYVGGIQISGGSTECTVENVSFDGLSWAGVLIDSSNNNDVLNNRFQNWRGSVEDTSDICIYRASNYNLVSGNDCYGGGHFGVVIQDPYDGTKPTGNIVTNNHVGQHLAYGILVYVTTAYDTKTIIANNFVKDIQGSAGGGGSSGTGIYIQSAGGSIVTGNQVYNCAVQTSNFETNGIAGIGVAIGEYLTGTLVEVIVSNNHVDMPRGPGIFCTASSKGITLEGNTIHVTGTTAVRGEGIYAINCKYLKILGNTIRQANTNYSAINLVSNNLDVTGLEIADNSIETVVLGIGFNNSGTGSFSDLIFTGNRVLGGSGTSLFMHKIANALLSNNNLSSSNGSAITVNSCTRLRASGNRFFGANSGVSSIVFVGTNTGSVVDETNILAGTVQNDPASGVIIAQYANAAPPGSGAWNVGDRVIQSVPAVGSPKGWRCTVAGTPGTWVSEGNL